VGHNLTAQQPDNAERGSLARYKFGAGTSRFLYQDKNNTDRRVVFEAFTIERFFDGPVEKWRLTLSTQKIVPIKSGLEKLGSKPI